MSRSTLPFRTRIMGLLALTLVAVIHLSVPALAGDEAFPRPEGFEPAIDFWKDVFSRYDYDQVIYMDGRDVSRVYEVRRIPTPDGTRSRLRKRDAARAQFKKEIRLDLEALAASEIDYDSLAGRRLRLFRVWDESRDPAVYSRAAKNLRGQRGIRESFLSGVERSARYVEDFKRILREEGVPEELVYLPHVESSYQQDVRSSAGAVGMWQIMHQTGKRFLTIDSSVDERLDPHAASRAAARYLRELLEETGSWPLAVTAYNQGPSAMRTASRKLETTDISVIVREYEGRGFGFMGRNFYAEFLAAGDLAEEILAEPEAWRLEPHQPRSFGTFALPAFVKLESVTRAFSVSPGELHELNPGFTGGTLGGSEYLPKGYALKLPPDSVADAGSLFAGIPSGERHAKRPQQQYRVRSGDTLGGIAARFSTSVRAIQQMNGISNPNRLRAGQVLRLPS